MVRRFDAKTKDSKGIVIPARQQYEDEYRDEIELNETFNKFVANYQLYYQGPNTAQAQVMAKYEERKSEGGRERGREGGRSNLLLFCRFSKIINTFRFEIHIRILIGGFIHVIHMYMYILYTHTHNYILGAPYSDFLDDECTVPGDEYLPLGPAFQV